MWPSKRSRFRVGLRRKLKLGRVVWIWKYRGVKKTIRALLSDKNIVSFACLWQAIIIIFIFHHYGILVWVLVSVSFCCILHIRFNHVSESYILHFIINFTLDWTGIRAFLDSLKYEWGITDSYERDSFALW